MRKRVVPIAGVFGHLHEPDQRHVHAVTATLSLLCQPGGEFAAGDGSSVTEHAVGVFQIVRQILGQCQRDAAHDGFEVQCLAQLKQPLAQCIARGIGVAVGPQQCGQARARRRPFERQPGQQRSVPRRQREGRAIGADNAGRGSSESKLIGTHEGDSSRQC